MKVQKISNFENRMKKYRSDCTNFWLKEFSVFALIGAVVIFGLMYGASKIPGFKPPLNLDWKQIALLLWVVAIILPIKMMHPEKPSPEDVSRDQLLRRLHGMDDSVER